MTRARRDEYGLQRSIAHSPVIIPRAAKLETAPVWKRQPRTCLAVTLAFIVLSLAVVFYAFSPL